MSEHIKNMLKIVVFNDEVFETKSITSARIYVERII